MSKKGNGFGKFLAGAAIGVGLGVLFAPKAGVETRKELKEKMDELVKKVKELDVEEVKENFLKKIEELKEELADLDKEKATPVVQKTVEDLKAKTVVVLKDTVKKLEEPKNDSSKKEAPKKEKNNEK